MRRFLRSLLVTLSVAGLATGCVSERTLDTAGRRLGKDAFVVFTSPAQIPAMSFRDAATVMESPGASAVAFPITFPLFVVEHALLMITHALDMTLLGPVQPFVDWEPLPIYDTTTFPMRLNEDSEDLVEIGLLIVIALGGGTALSLLVQEWL